MKTPRFSKDSGHASKSSACSTSSPNSLISTSGSPDGGEVDGLVPAEGGREVALRRLLRPRRQVERLLEHYVGGRKWRGQWKKSDTSDGSGSFYYARGPTPRWWQPFG